MPSVLVIPAYRPGAELLRIAAAVDRRKFAAVVVVDDGSGPEYAPVFAGCEAEVLRHDKNLGKGAALRTGIRYVLEAFPGMGVVTADADGQHHPEDIERVARRLEQEPHALVLGARSFDGEVPGRSRAGNRLARAVFRVLVGASVRDTQTGLRGVPQELLTELAATRSPGYEFEVDMLLAARHRGIPLVEEPVRTIYQPGNPSSHFRPLRDSMRIGFVLARFTMLSLATAALDNLVFAAAIGAGFGRAAAQTTARAVAMCFNYPLARRAVFLSREPHRSTLPRYLALVAASGFVSYHLLHWLEEWLRLPVLHAKIAAESALFLFNFLAQRDWVFLRRRAPCATDWDRYYCAPTRTAHLTRRYTGRVLADALRRYGGRVATLVELGGANSCFLEKIQREVRPRNYHVVDTNAYGLSLLKGRKVILHQQDCTELSLRLQADAVFSVGLIEHFDPAGTVRAVAAHFALLKPGGCAIISFPTPTWLYRAARWITEAAGLWQFPDERPLSREEVAAAAAPFAQIQFEKILWPIVFTQRLMVFRKNP